MFKLYDIAKKISGILVYVTYAILLGAMFFITYSVIARFVFKAPLLGSVEIVEVAMSAMVFASLAFTQTQKGHVHITMLIRVLPAKLGMALFAVGALLTTAISGAAAYACFLEGQYVQKIELVTLMTGIPYAPFYFFATVCMCLMTFVLLLDALMAVAGIFNDRYAEKVRESW